VYVSHVGGSFGKLEGLLDSRPSRLGLADEMFSMKREIMQEKKPKGCNMRFRSD
jgi:hypothetical protein